MVLQRFYQERALQKIINTLLLIQSYVVTGDISNRQAPGLVFNSNDPRIGAACTRILCHNESFDILNFTKEIGGEAEVFADAHDYDKFRILNGLAEGPELSQRIPLECNFDHLNYVNFEKGCFIGQELTARTKYMVCSNLVENLY